jgi:hypothetical protein
MRFCEVEEKKNGVRRRHRLNTSGISDVKADAVTWHPNRVKYMLHIDYTTINNYEQYY